MQTGNGAGAVAQPIALTVRGLTENDLPEAQWIVRRAFATFVGAPDPETFWTDREYVHSRWAAPHVTAFAAEVEGRLAGANFATQWGSVGFFGPLAIRPDLWDRGVGQRLVEAATIDLEARGVRHAGLFTFANSPKHMALYQRFGYAPCFLTVIMSAPVNKSAADRVRWLRYSALSEAERARARDECRDLTDALYEGLDLGDEIQAVHTHGLGDVVLLWDRADKLNALAVCHHGPRSEAGQGACFVKFGAARPGPQAEESFAALLDACAGLATEAGMTSVLAGVSTARREAHRHLVARGFRTEVTGVAMHRPDEPGYSRPGVFVLDDWR
ncbi:GNAT family N-acetyltransferase [Dankookia rubra]|uniref:GNAT family N-acetyltransferase n=2 Tax=Dankookia rubra TaxID=1442381 RepID=A0A4R5Q6S4_9PROT|nr:GNAT family N-acetyltransferase [Dankookia rubra]